MAAGGIVLAAILVDAIRFRHNGGGGRGISRGHCRMGFKTQHLKGSGEGANRSRGGSGSAAARRRAKYRRGHGRNRDRPKVEVILHYLRERNWLEDSGWPVGGGLPPRARSMFQCAGPHHLYGGTANMVIRWRLTGTLCPTAGANDVVGVLSCEHV
jgi:hypothetical protein